MRQLLPALLLAATLAACSSTGTKQIRVDRTDERNAVNTHTDTVMVDSIRVDTLWLPGMTLTVPETVEVAQETPTPEDTTDAFPLQELAVDSAQVRVTGLTEEYRLATPCFGQRLIGRPDGEGMEFYVNGECIPRDTVIEVKYEKESWMDRTTDRLARWISLFALLGAATYLLWGTISTAIKAALPW